jgi:predicted nucleic acid-binding protein
VWTYFDTSALVKRYVDEPGRREVLQLLKQNECVTSAVLPVELRSALRRRVSEGSIDAARLPAILKHVAADRRYWTASLLTGGLLVRIQPEEPFP